MNKRLNEYLIIGDINGEKFIQCAKCKYVFCAATENYKRFSLMRELSPTKNGTLLKTSDKFVLREFYCPDCGVMYDMQIQLRGEPILWDVHLKI